MSGAVTADDGARVVVRPIGSPLPLGFLALVVATVGFAALQLQWVPASQGSAVALGVLVLTVPLQLLASVLAFLARDVVAGTGMGLLAGTWGATALVTLTGAPGAASSGLGVLLVAAGVSMLVPAAAATSKPVAAAVMLLTAVRYTVTGVAELTADRAWFTAAGAVGLVLGAVALYAALAFALEDAHRRTVLPLGRRGSGADVLTASAREDLRDVAHEAGVRRQL
ncbi:hypothetical protein ICW40_08165 [Actinotalea ferrariae]|uniref:hypothetical protein n=1 Tax=Actinotalea ferrariae TaxID=1386098 RepID=UPI001C8B7D4C|nr:hypothetical protein [Actinotalea ferrariae]MBX9244783.1 hypothetical protein [Actinotalea ferrariae]